MAEDLIPILTRFHREVFLPDFERIVGEAFGGLEHRMKAHFEACQRGFDTLEPQHQASHSSRQSSPVSWAGGSDQKGE